MRKILLIMLMVLALGASAQRQAGERQQKWREQLKEYRHNFLIRDLALTSDQQSKFFPLYDEMNERIEELNIEVRDITRKIDSDSKLSDVALAAYAKRLFEQKSLEGEIELEYYEKFKSILNAKQLARIKSAEVQILRNLNKFHRERKMPPSDER